MNWPDWQGKRVAVLGFGVEGRSSVAFFVRQGAVVTVHDDQPIDRAFMPEGATVASDGAAFQNLVDYDVIIRSPGVRMDHSGLVGVPADKLTSQTELFLQRWHDRSIGVTGSKGKGITTSLIAHALQQSGHRALVGGNIGTPLLDIADGMDESSWAVLELSSFQLQDVGVSPHVAVMLMVVPEHLDYHGELSRYVAAKHQLIAHQTSDDLAVINLMYPLSAEMKTRTAARVLTVGIDDADAVIADGAVVFGGSKVRIALVDTRLNGLHNLQNIAAAGLAVAGAGVTNEQFRTVLPTFEPLPHRLQTVAMADGVQYVNDSFATAPEATMAAVKSFTGPLVLIVGGSSKQIDLTGLVEAIDLEAREGRLVGVVAIGQTGQEIASALRQPFPVSVVTGLTEMSDMVSNARHLLAAAGGRGTILLSPGAASFGLFTDYKQRGELFTIEAEKASQLR